MGLSERPGQGSGCGDGRGPASLLGGNDRSATQRVQEQMAQEAYGRVLWDREGIVRGFFMKLLVDKGRCSCNPKTLAPSWSIP